MDPIHVEEPATSEPVQPVQTPEKDAIVARVTDDAALVAHEAMAAAPTPAELAKVATDGADSGLVGVVLAVVAVLGGGAAWKFYSQSSKQKADLARIERDQAHELAMAELNAKINAPTTSPPPCIAAHSSFEARIAACDAKISRANSVTLPDDFDVDEMLDRIEKLEKAAKKKTAPAGRKP